MEEGREQEEAEGWRRGESRRKETGGSVSKTDKEKLCV